MLDCPPACHLTVADLVAPPCHSLGGETPQLKGHFGEPKVGVGGVSGKGGIGENGGETTFRVATEGINNEIGFGRAGGAPDDKVPGGGVGITLISMILLRGVIIKGLTVGEGDVDPTDGRNNGSDLAGSWDNAGDCCVKGNRTGNGMGRSNGDGGGKETPEIREEVVVFRKCSGVDSSTGSLK
jgi:hypothetical protein